MTRAEPPVPLRTITEFASQQAEFLKHLFGLRNDRELANLSVIKLQEEVGEVAEAYLALQSLQRRDKLQRPTDAKAALGREIGDVTIVMALLADAVGLSFDEILLDRVDEIRTRREKLLAEATTTPSSQATYKPDLPLPARLEEDDQLQLFSDTP